MKVKKKKVRRRSLQEKITVILRKRVKKTGDL